MSYYAVLLNKLKSGNPCAIYPLLISVKKVSLMVLAIPLTSIPTAKMVAIREQ